MKRFAHRASTRRVSYRVIKKGACKACRFREQCTPVGQDRTVSRFFEQPLVDEAKQRLSEPRGQELLLQRKVSAEVVFAWAKELHGLRRTRFVGRWKVQIQLWLTAAVINIRRALKALTSGTQQVTSGAFVNGTLAEAAKELDRVLSSFFLFSEALRQQPQRE